MNNITRVLFLLFLSSLTLHTSADADVDCSTNAKETCLQLLKENTDFPEFPFGATEQELNVTCTNVESGLQCMDNYDKHCRLASVLTNDYKEHMKQRRDVITGICHPGPFQTEFFKHRTCLKATVPDLKGCDSLYVQANKIFQTAIQTDNNSQDFVKNMCCSYRTFMTCLREKTRSCGNEASFLLLGYVNRTEGSNMSEICTGYVGDCSENH